jgi:hypothetical protein
MLSTSATRSASGQAHAGTSLRHGASLSHIRRYLGQISDRMAEHYANPRVLHQPGAFVQVA